MTDPLLNYQTPAPAAAIGLRTATWIYLLVLGILYGLGGLCAGGSMGFAYVLLKSRPGVGTPPRIGMIVLAVGIGMLVICLGICAAFIWAALRLRRGSRAAAITALVLSSLGTAGFLAIVGMGVVMALTMPGRDPSMLIGVLVYLVPAMANGAAVVLLVVLMRRQRRAAYGVTVS